MHCLSCKVKMLEGSHEETETFEKFVFVMKVEIKECPACSALVKTVLPAYVRVLK